MKNVFWTDERRDYHRKIVMSDENRARQSEFMKGYWTDERRLEKSEQRKEYFKNNPNARKQISQNVKQQTKTCEYCGIVLSLRNYSKWHGVKCSKNPDVCSEALEERTRLGRSNRGRKFSKDVIDKRNETRKLRGINPQPHTQETKQRLREIAKNRPKVKCVYCGFETTKQNHDRWHRK